MPTLFPIPPLHLPPLTHTSLDLLLLVSLTLTAFLLGDVRAFLNETASFVQAFPFDHYRSVFDFTTPPEGGPTGPGGTRFPPALATGMLLTDVYFLVKTYVLEKPTVDHAHKKYVAHRNTVFVAVHGIGSSLEFLTGFLAVVGMSSCSSTSLMSSSRVTAVSGSSQQWWIVPARMSALLALFINVPSGLVLNRRVFGIKHLTVPGFLLFGFLRAGEAVRVLFVDERLVPNLWILLHVGTMVRLLGYFSLVTRDRADQHPTEMIPQIDVPTFFAHVMHMHDQHVVAYTGRIRCRREKM